MNNYIFIVAIQNQDIRTHSYGYSIDAWKKWAEQFDDVEVLTLTEPIDGLSKPHYSRYFIPEIMEMNELEYDKLLIVDADTIPHPKMPNIFELAGDDFCAVFNDGDMDWVIRSYENWKEEFKFEPFSIWEYFNSGVMVINKKHAPIFKYLTDFFRNNEKTCLSLYQKYGVGNDQPLINFIVRKFTDIKLLPYQFNMTDMIRKNILYNLEYLEIKGLYHFNAIPNNQSGLWMKKTYDELYRH